ncbi:MAG: hypothetical protein IKN55_12180 [Oscillospiraceae bacterium]|nr:hypothetical protein [Oscillospiraceae bacterium]
MHRNSLLGASPAASFLYNLTKNLTAHLHHQLCAVLPLRSLKHCVVILISASLNDKKWFVSRPGCSYKAEFPSEYL